MSNVIRLKDEDGNYIYPVTHASIVFDSEGKSIEDELNELNSKISKDSIDYIDYIKPSDFGAVGDGVNDDTVALQTCIEQAIQQGKSVLIDRPLLITDTIDVIRGSRIIFSANGLIQINSNINGFDLKRDVRILGPAKFMATYTVDNVSVINFDGTNTLNYRDIYLEDVTILGNNASGKGNAINFICANGGNSISFVVIDNLVVRGFSYGIKMDAPRTTSTAHNYINGNIFKNAIISDCDYYIFLTGAHHTTYDQVDGNIFVNILLQYSKRCIEAIHIEGRQNIFKGFGFDFLGKDSIVIRLTDTSLYNVIDMRGIANTKIYDNGRSNEIEGVVENVNNAYCKEAPVKRSEKSYSFNGDYEDILHMAHKMHPVTVLEGNDCVTSGTIDEIFQSVTYKYLRLDLSGDKTFSFEIDFTVGNYPGYTNNMLYGGIKTLVFCFNSCRTPKSISIEVTDINSNTYTDVLNLQEISYNENFCFRYSSINGLNKHLAKIKVTLIGQVGSDVRFAKMCANSFTVGGVKYVSNFGGNMYGDMVYTKNSGVVLESPNGTKYRLIVSDDGTITSKKIE